jgi:hypothetical protein
MGSLNGIIGSYPLRLPLKANDIDYSAIASRIKAVENTINSEATEKNNNQEKNGFFSSSKDFEKKIKEMEIRRLIAELQSIDAKVKAHEMAHASVGGQYAGSPSYSYVKGPDGRLYAVAGEVPIDVSPEDTPEKTIAKMQQVIAAALAPADPSPQDYKVAALASQQLNQAYAELAKEKAEKQKEEIENTKAEPVSEEDMKKFSSAHGK